MRRLAIAIAIFSLGACDQATPSDVVAVQPDHRICEVPPKVKPGMWGACLHKWAYRLAGAPGSNAEIASAAVTACADEEVYQINAAGPDKASELADAIDSADQGIALFRVIQARAGHCAIPED